MRWLIVVPNLLSACRLALALVFPWADERLWAWLIIAAGLTDFADGFIARRFKLTSWAGGLLDGVADKAFVLSVLVSFTRTGDLHLWQTLLLLSRDFAVGFIAAYAAMAGKWYAFRHMPSRWPGKVTTAILFVFFVLLAGLEERGMGLKLLMAVAAASSLVAALDYLALFVRSLKMDRQRIKPLT